jgi:hypothetical protein
MTKTTVFFYVGKTSFKSAWKVVFCFSCFYFHLFLRLFFLIFLFVFLLISFHSFVESVISFLSYKIFFVAFLETNAQMLTCTGWRVHCKSCQSVFLSVFCCVMLCFCFSFCFLLCFVSSNGLTFSM